MSKILLKKEQQSDINTPDNGYAVIFIDSVDGKIKVKDDTGSVREVLFTSSGAPVDKNYVQQFNNVSQITITHNLGKIPSISLIDDNNNYFVGSITLDQQNPNNVIHISWEGSKSGMVVCN